MLKYARIELNNTLSEKQESLLGARGRRGGWDPNQIVLFDIARLSLPIAAEGLSNPLAFESDAALQPNNRRPPLFQVRNDLPPTPPSFLAISIHPGQVFARLDPSLLRSALLEMGDERNESLDCLHASPEDVTDQPPARSFPSVLPSMGGRARA